MVVEKLPPSNVEAEEAVLGSLLIDPEAILKVAPFLISDYFYREKNGWIYQAIRDLYERREPIDFLTVCDELERRGQLEEVGGPAYLTDLINSVPTAIHVEHYAHIVERTALRRRLITAAGDIARVAYEDTEEIDQTIDRAEQILFAVAQQRLTRHLIPIRQLLGEYFDRIEYLYQHRGELGGLPTGFADLDKILGGLQSSDLIIVAGRPGMGKCVTADTRVVNPYTGDLVTIEELVRRRQASLLTLAGDYKLQPAEASDFVDDGIKPVYRVRTALGREIKVTLAHPFLTINGWRPLGELSVGDFIAVPRVVPVFGNYDAPEYEVKVLACLLADGCLTRQNPQFTNSNPRLREDFIAAALQFPGTKVRLIDSQGRRTPTIYVAGDPVFINRGRMYFAQQLSSIMQQSSWSQANLAKAVGVHRSLVPQWIAGKCVPSSQTFTRLCNALNVLADQLAPDGLAAISRTSPNTLTVWLQKQGMWGRSAAEKDIPACVYCYTRQKLALFLNRLFACDGSIYIQNGKQAAISYGTVSLRMARAVQHLLLRFGIIAKLRHRQSKYGNSYRPFYELRITGASNLLQFTDEIGAFGKEEVIAEVQAYAQERVANPNLDLIPREIWTDIVQAKGHRTWRSLYKEMGLPAEMNIHVGQRAPSRQRVLAIGQALKSDHLIDLAQSHVYWDRIVSIEYLGEQQVYDLTIPDTHNYVADDMIVHNTSLVLSIAEHMAIHHRDLGAIAIFSLEMGAEQVAQRLISSETGIDSQRLRLGRVRDDEIDQIVRAIGLLSETAIFVDDTPAISPFELRTKARRLHAERPLGLIIIDYLQLMQAGVRAENRVQEISFISRSLKSLAREIKVPVIAASQLSRAVESRHDKRPILSDLRESGCLTGDTLIMRADTGQLVPIKQLAEEGISIPVLTLGENLKLRVATLIKAFPSGRKQVYLLRTRSGREIKASVNHPFRQLTGWTRLDELRPGDRIAIPREAFANSDLYWDEIVSIEALGVEEVYDATVPGTHNFVANNIIVHNSIEQDADVVLFIYRDEMYNEYTVFKNIAEVHVAKHRNGPVGKIELAFIAEQAKFMSLYREPA